MRPCAFFATLRKVLMALKNNVKQLTRQHTFSKVHIIFSTSKALLLHKLPWNICGLKKIQTVAAIWNKKFHLMKKKKKFFHGYIKKQTRRHWPQRSGSTHKYKRPPLPPHQRKSLEKMHQGTGQGVQASCNTNLSKRIILNLLLYMSLIWFLRNWHLGPNYS